MQRDQHVQLGRKILEKVFADEGHELTDKAVERLMAIAKGHGQPAEIKNAAKQMDELQERMAAQAAAMMGGANGPAAAPAAPLPQTA